MKKVAIVLGITVLGLTGCASITKPTPVPTPSYYSCPDGTTYLWEVSEEDCSRYAKQQAERKARWTNR